MAEEDTGDTRPEPVSIPRHDLLAVWKVIEKLVVSADRIAGAYEFQDEDSYGNKVIDDEMRQRYQSVLTEYLEELTPEFLEARNTLLEYLDLDDEDANHLTSNVIQYWSGGRPTIDYDGEELGEPDNALT